MLGKEEAQASADIGTTELDALMVNLRMEGVLVREELNFKVKFYFWFSKIYQLLELILVEHIHK